MRLFVAIYLPPELQRKVWMSGETIKGAWKRDPEEKMHITLKFIGEVPEDRLKDIDEALRKIKHPPFWVEVIGAGAFPSKDRPRVLWIGAKGEGLHSLHEMIEEELFTLGIPKEYREFVPHVTLGRAKGKVDASLFFEKFEKHYFGAFEAKEFVLVRSILKPTGSEYTIIGRYPLED